MRKKILLFVGTRPEAIKMAPVIRELMLFKDQFDTRFCATGQHKEMLDQVLTLFDLKPDYDLGLMKNAQQLHDLSARALIASTEVIRDFRPDCVLVQGDTSTAMVCGLAAFYQKVPVGHVEAGLRTNNIYYPFPEEINRRLLSQLATFHFVPTETALKALLSESVPREHILLTGNTVIDALLWVVQKKSRLPKNFVLNERKLILVTAHRRESWGAPLEEICDSILELENAFSDIEFIYPVHRNPVVWNTVFNKLSHRKRIYLIEPVEYDVLVGLMNHSYLILTDSGGIQEEAPALGKPVLVLRNETERPEAVDAGVAKLVGTKRQRIVDEVTRLLSDQIYYNGMAKCISPYGDGKASERIVSYLLQHITDSPCES